MDSKGGEKEGERERESTLEASDRAARGTAAGSERRHCSAVRILDTFTVRLSANSWRSRTLCRSGQLQLLD